MTIMVGEFLDPDQVAISQDERTALYQDQRAAAHWRIWIGRHAAQDHPLWSHNAMTFAENADQRLSPSEIPTSNAQTSTILLGQHLAVHTMSSRVAWSIFRRWRLPEPTTDALIQIWPTRSSLVRWPPNFTLTEAGLRTVADHLYNRVMTQVQTL